MSNKKTFVRASDIGSWNYCKRAWWLARVQGVPHQRPQVLQRGEEVHKSHGRQLVRAHRLRQAGLYLIVIAVILIGLLLIIWSIQSSPFL